MSESFAYYRLPGSLTGEREKQLDDGFPTGELENQEDLFFEIGEWLAPYSRRITITNPLPITPTPTVPLSNKNSHSVPLSKDDDKEQYLKAAEAIIESCRAREGKTVFSRTIQGVNPALSPTAAASRLATIFPDALAFLFSTPQTGCWIGATPETLLNYDYRTRRVETMAYAGTRPFAGDAPWDTKNLRENQFVADHIVEKFRSFGIEPMVSAPYSSPYGALQHLRRDITAVLPDNVDYWQLLDAINPTPALCGTPTEAAIADINSHETTPRRCYGGFVAIHKPGDFFRSFVCLRCARIYPDGRFEIHTGGGLTPDSIPISEYRETEAKAASILQTLINTP